MSCTLGEDLLNLRFKLKLLALLNMLGMLDLLGTGTTLNILLLCSSGTSGFETSDTTPEVKACAGDTVGSARPNMALAFA